MTNQQTPNTQPAMHSPLDVAIAFDDVQAFQKAQQEAPYSGAIALPHLIIAAKAPNIFSHLIQTRQIDPLSQDYLQSAVRLNSSDIFTQLILAHGENSKQVLIYAKDTSATKYRDTNLLQSAAMNGHTDMVATIVANTDPNFEREDTRSPLFFALENDHEMTAIRLLEMGADHRATDPRTHQTVLAMATAHGHLAFIKKLLENPTYADAGISPHSARHGDLVQLAHDNQKTQVANYFKANGLKPSRSRGKSLANAGVLSAFVTVVLFAGTLATGSVNPFFGFIFLGAAITLIATQFNRHLKMLQKEGLDFKKMNANLNANDTVKAWTGAAALSLFMAVGIPTMFNLLNLPILTSFSFILLASLPILFTLAVTQSIEHAIATREQASKPGEWHFTNAPDTEGALLSIADKFQALRSDSARWETLENATPYETTVITSISPEMEPKRKPVASAPPVPPPPYSSVAGTPEPDTTQAASTRNAKF